jgi:hypothetical protein
VDRHVAQHGGRSIRGWCIWEVPGHFIEGVFHSVWERPDHTVIDPTPQPDRESRILFVPDARIEWTGPPIGSHRLALSQERWVHRRIAIAEGQEALERKYRPASGRANIPMVEILNMVLSHTGRNDPCPCESGRKYKKCCEGASLDTLFSRMRSRQQAMYGSQS